MALQLPLIFMQIENVQNSIVYATLIPKQTIGTAETKSTYGFAFCNIIIFLGNGS